MAPFFSFFHRQGWWHASALPLLLFLELAGCSASGVAGSSNEKGPQSSEATDGAVAAAGGAWDEMEIYSSGKGGAASQGGAPAGAEVACLRVMSWGKPASQGMVPGQAGLDAVVNWLNTSSTAQAEHFAEQVPITKSFLAEYQVVLLQDLTDWKLEPSEIVIFAQWVKAGGAVMALSGYTDTADGAQVSNKLLAFSGLSFSVTPRDTALVLGECGYCLGNSRAIQGFDPNHPIAREVHAVGAYLGRSVLGDGEFVASEDGSHLAVAKSVEQGRVFLYHDDWITYVAEWTGHISHYCESNPSCSQAAPEQSYQVGQLWYNALSWLAPQASCLAIDSSNVVK